MSPTAQQCAQPRAVTGDGTRPGGYRPDVDGLRGIAILAVLLFHFDLAGARGGFVGVDVFFVISGFLITGNILGEWRAGTWSFAGFYLRRVRRLFPALCVTLVAALLAASLLLMPHELEWFASTLIHASVSTSNLLFWQELGYFGPAVERTPLLHTWSLSVEEQFYLVWPLFLLALLRLGGVRLLMTMVALAGALSLWGGQRLLGADAQAAFYLMPWRIFEFAAGALLVWIPRPPPRLAWLEEVVLLAGLGAILYAIARFDPATPFPGYHALVPCLGAAAAIHAGRARRVGVLLGNRPLVAVGLISYSLYLVHWPLLVFAQFAAMRPLDGLERLGLMLCAIALAALMLRYVERPFRRASGSSGHLSPAAFGLASAGLTIALMWTATTVLISDGWLWRMRPEIRGPIATLDGVRGDRGRRFRMGQCHLNEHVGDTETAGGFLDERCLVLLPDRPNYLVAGDSHGADRYVGLAAQYPEVNFLQMTGSGCRPLLDTHYSEFHCRERVDYLYRNFLPQTRVDGVILAARWEAGDIPALRATLTYLQGLGMRVILLGPAIEYSPWVPDLVFRYGRLDGLEDWVGRFTLPERRELDQRLRQLSVETGAEYHSIIAAFCPSGTCPVLSREGDLLVVDYGHQSAAGALAVGRGLREQGLRLTREKVDRVTERDPAGAAESRPTPRLGRVEMQL